MWGCRKRTLNGSAQSCGRIFFCHESEGREVEREQAVLKIIRGRPERHTGPRERSYETGE